MLLNFAPKFIKEGKEEKRLIPVTTVRSGYRIDKKVLGCSKEAEHPKGVGYPVLGDSGGRAYHLLVRIPTVQPEE